MIGTKSLTGSSFSAGKISQTHASGKTKPSLSALWLNWSISIRSISPKPAEYPAPRSWCAVPAVGLPEPEARREGFFLGGRDSPAQEKSQRPGRSRV